MDLHRGLVVLGRGEDLALARGDGGVSLDHLGHHATESFNTQRQWRNVEQQHILHFSGQHAALHRRAYRDDFVGIDALVRLASKQLLH